MAHPATIDRAGKHAYVRHVARNAEPVGERRRRRTRRALAVAVALATASAAPAGASHDESGFGFTPATPAAGQTVTFTSEPARPDKVIAQAWDLDGNGDLDATGATATRAYGSPGTYTVRHVIVERGFRIRFSSAAVTVYHAPAASFEISPDAPVAGQPVTLTSTSADPDGSIVAAGWDTDGDGSFDDASGASVSATFAAGDHPVSLLVTDSQGITSTATRSVAVAAAPVVTQGPPPNRAPVAVISHLPRVPRVGEPVELNVTAGDPDGDLLQHAWDLDADGSFDDATGAAATTTFATPGEHPVAVRSTDSAGASVVAFDSITVVPLPSQAVARLTPFPVVRVKGTAYRRHTRIRLFSVLAPGGTRVKVRCRGRSCPARRISRHVPADRPAKVLRIRKLERRLRAGTRLRVTVTRTGMIGKYTRLVLRRLKPPRRQDACIVPGRARPAACSAVPGEAGR
jgi:PKD repeat protein